ncbi:MAG: family 10 glycosylhydrolase [Bacteroidales bacterium]|nr:family 10 glycosylhydrolase [Bacteroidales bacterium]
MKQIFLLLIFLLIAMPVEARRKKTAEDVVPVQKQEFRGTWLQTAFQERYQKMSPDQCKKYLQQVVEDLSDAGFNAIIFQMRPEGDAFYKSSIEPWSRFLTGTQGLAPKPEWDPMAYLIALCHQHQMEFHAWLNPYRMTASKWTRLDPNHLYNKHPEWFVRYDDKLYLNPAMPECRSYVRDVVKDIVSRYDIDAIHMDDYFYPYPIKGLSFNDQATFEAYAPMMNFDLNDPASLGKFRRRSVDILIKSLHEDIQTIKPWVRFGISPFGIYRHASADYKNGSKTSGTQCYSDLYADVIFWAQSGWIDYVIPQLYWEIGHPQADYSTLVKWWSDNVPNTCHLYIGQSIERSLDDPKDSKPAPDLRINHGIFSKKLAQAASCKNVKGNCFWYGYQLDDNTYHVRDFLHNTYYQQPAFAPAFTHIDAIAPEKVQKLNIAMSTKGLHITWRFLETQDPLQKPRYFCVYKFLKGEKTDVSDCSHLLLRTQQTEFYDADIARSSKFTYVVTAVDAVGNESVPVKKSFKVKIK